MTTGRYSVLLMVGAPGAGKGTQARCVSESLGIPHVATGDLLRDHRRRGTDLGQTARAYMDRGDLVPDDLVVKMVIERLEASDAANGVLLDGFPRTLPQAVALDQELKTRGGGVEAVLFLDVPEEVLVRRISGRRICQECPGVYHVDLGTLPEDDRCPDCAGQLIQRRDDRREVVERRLAVYAEETQPVLDHYRGLGVVSRLDGNRPIDAIRFELLALVERLRRRRLPSFDLATRPVRAMQSHRAAS